MGRGHNVGDGELIGAYVRVVREQLFGRFTEPRMNRYCASYRFGPI